MTYSTSYCPHCKKPIEDCINPSKEIGIPFANCPFCGKVYLKRRTEEWITKSPFKRHIYFLQSGTWARAFLLPLLFWGIILLALFDVDNNVLFWILWACSFIVYMIIGYFFHRNRSLNDIKKSLQRTSDNNYLELLKQAGYKIYPCTEETPMDFNNSNDKTDSN